MRILTAALAASLVVAADPSRPHLHQGVLDPFKPGPPAALTSSELASLNAGTPVQKTTKVMGRDGKESGRATAVFDVSAPPSVVWDCINDLKNYPNMVPGVSAMEVYRGPSTSGGVTTTHAKWTLALLGYRLSYYLVTRYEPRLNSMTFRLDYSRDSDISDSVGHWHVVPLAGPDGSTHSRVTYSAALTLRGWFPKAVIDLLFATTLGRATSWVSSEALKRVEISSGAAGPTKCRWSWKRMRKVCSPEKPHSLEAAGRAPSARRATMDYVAYGLTLLTVYLLATVAY